MHGIVVIQPVANAAFIRSKRTDPKAWDDLRSNRRKASPEAAA